MSDHSAPAAAAREYAAAYAAHYSERELAIALQLYRKLMASHASAPEAGYSRTQIQNIVKVVVPEQELLDAQVELALVRLERPISAAPELTRMNPARSSAHAKSRRRGTSCWSVEHGQDPRLRPL